MLQKDRAGPEPEPKPEPDVGMQERPSMSPGGRGQDSITGSITCHGPHWQDAGVWKWSQ